MAGTEQLKFPVNSEGLHAAQQLEAERWSRYEANPTDENLSQADEAMHAAAAVQRHILLHQQMSRVLAPGARSATTVKTDREPNGARRGPAH